MSDSKFGVGDLISEKKRESAKHKAIKTEKNDSIQQQKNKSIKMKKDNYIKLQQLAGRDDYVGVNARVLRVYRDHWAVEAKKRRTTVSETIVNALLKEFGEPELYSTDDLS